MPNPKVRAAFDQQVVMLPNSKHRASKGDSAFVQEEPNYTSRSPRHWNMSD